MINLHICRATLYLFTGSSVDCTFSSPIHWQLLQKDIPLPFISVLWTGMPLHPNCCTFSGELFPLYFLLSPKPLANSNWICSWNVDWLTIYRKVHRDAFSGFISNTLSILPLPRYVAQRMEPIPTEWRLSWADAGWWPKTSADIFPLFCRHLLPKLAIDSSSFSSSGAGVCRVDKKGGTTPELYLIVKRNKRI